jgi:hypothetical protein
MYHYTYRIIVNNPTDERKYYVGVRSCDLYPTEDTLYFGSCKPFKKWQKQYGTTGLVKEILAIYDDRINALEHEIRLHEYFDVAKNKEFWNRAKQVSTGFDTTGTTDIYNKGIPMSLEQRKKISIAKTGKPLSEEHKRRVSNGLKGKPKSEEHKMKIKLANQDRLKSSEYKEYVKMKRLNKELA